MLRDIFTTAIFKPLIVVAILIVLFLAAYQIFKKDGVSEEEEMLFVDAVKAEMQRNGIPMSFSFTDFQKASDPERWIIPERANLVAVEAEEVWCVFIETGPSVNGDPPFIEGKIPFILARRANHWEAQVIYEGYYPLGVDAVFNSVGCDD